MSARTALRSEFAEILGEYQTFLCRAIRDRPYSLKRFLRFKLQFILQSAGSVLHGIPGKLLDPGAADYDHDNGAQSAGSLDDIGESHIDSSLFIMC